MASIRIVYDPNTVIGAKIRAAVSNIVEARKSLWELNSILTAFDVDTTSLSTLSGVAAGDVPTLKGYVNFAQAELGGLTLGAISSGAKTNAKMLADAMG